MRGIESYLAGIESNHLALVSVFVIALLTGAAASSSSAPDISEQAADLSHDFRLASKMVSGYSTSSPEEGAKRIIMIDIDTLRADHLGYHGYNRSTSPYIDSFARNNTFFTNAVTPAPWTRAAQMSIFTGAYPRTHGLTTFRHVVPSRYSMLAEQLNRGGYATAAFTGGHDLKDGVGFEQGFDTYRDYEKWDYTSLDTNFRRAFDWINSTRDHKSFVFIHGYDMHSPYGDTDSADEYTVKGVAGPISKSQLFYENGSVHIRKEDGAEELDRSDIEKIRRAYDQDLRSADSKLQNFFSRLKERGLYEDSTIILYSSHGENLGNHVYNFSGGYQTAFGHVFLWRHSTHVPLIVKSPSGGNGSVDEPVSLIDLGSTVRDFAGIEPGMKASLQNEGVSLLETAETGDRGKPVYSETKSLKPVSIINGRYQLIDRPRGEEMLYSLQGERLNLSGNKEVYSELSNRIDEWRDETPETYDEAVSVEFESPLTRFIAGMQEKNFFGQVSNSIRAEDLVVEAPGSFDIERSENRTVSGRKARFVGASTSKRRVEARAFLNVSQKFSEEYREQEVREVLSVYQGTVPYTTKPGYEKCGEDYQPEVRRIESKKLTIVTMYADNEGFYGACEEEAVYRVRMYLGFCGDERGTLYKVSDRVPVEDREERLGVGCA